MAITRTPMVDDDGTGTTGTVINNAWKQQFYDQIDAADAALGTAALGVYTSIPYDPLNFGGTGGMTWTVSAANVATYGYVQVNKLLIVTAVISNTTVGGTAAVYLSLKVPGVVFFKDTFGLLRLGIGAGEIGYAQALANTPTIALLRPQNTVYPLGALAQIFVTVAAVIA